MSRRKDHVPSYRLHKQSGQAVVTLSDGLGNRRDVLLGKHGSAESRAEYARVLAEWEAGGRRLPQATSAPGVSVNEVILAYWRYVEQNYHRPDGTPSRQLDNVRDALRPLKELYGHTAARDFGPRALKAVQARMVELGLCRNTVNRRLGRIKTMFRWAESEELIPPSTLHSLLTVRGLAKGRSAARETDPVRPVHPSVVEATLPHMLPTVADMVRLQQATGMRSGELVVMRPIDIDTTGEVWLYRPGSDRGPAGEHKTAHHGHQRVVAIGPQGQAVVAKYLRTDLYAYLFSPQEAVAGLRAGQRRGRKTRVQPSQQNRRRARPKVCPGGRYTVGTYRQAIERACDRAFPPPEALAPREGETAAGWQARLADEQKAELTAWQKAHRWFPHQLRHAKATEIRREHGIDAARAVLGHTSPTVTEIYAELDVGKAAEVMRRLG